MLFLTNEQHKQVVRRLLALGRESAKGTPLHSTGLEYTSLMACFLLHQLSCAESLLRMAASFGDEWFPVSVGYSIARTMFEADVTAHYISKNPKKRALQYIAFGSVLNKRHMDSCLKHQKSKDPQWQEAMKMLWQGHWAALENDVNSKYQRVRHEFTYPDGKNRVFQNWSGKSIRQMAVEVDHEEAYDIFYAELSSFTHVNVHLADRFLQQRSDGPVWSQRADEFDVGNVFRHAASFLTCYLNLFGKELRTCDEAAVSSCWQMKTKN